MPSYTLGLLALDEADEYHDNSYYDDAIQQFRNALTALAKDSSPLVKTNVEPVLHFYLGYAYGKLRQPWRAVGEFQRSQRCAKRYSRTWFAAEANIRRYRHKHSPALSHNFQMTVFMTLGIALSLAIVGLEFKQRLTTPYLVTLIAFAIILFVVAFYLPIVTSIKLGPVSLEKKPAEVGQDQPEPISIAGSPLDTRLDQWKFEQLSGSSVPSQVPSAPPLRTPTEPLRTPTEPEPTPVNPPNPPATQ
jgi:hypothetical protein